VRSGRMQLSRAARSLGGILRRTYRSPDIAGAGYGDGSQRTPSRRSRAPDDAQNAAPERRPSPSPEQCRTAHPVCSRTQARSALRGLAHAANRRLGAGTLSFRHLQAGFNPALAWGRASRWRIVRFACAGGCCIWVRHSDFASCLDEILDHGGLLANHDLFVGHDANHDAALFH
jgi:hypothetical protein